MILRIEHILSCSNLPAQTGHAFHD